jgi:hypothetical protein
MAAALFLLLAGCSNGHTGARAGTSAPGKSGDRASGGRPGSGSTASTTLVLQPPVTVVEIGDSLGIDLGLGLHDALASDAQVTLVQAAKGDSGLVEPQFYDWPLHLQELLAEYHPQIVVVFLGANDVQGFYEGSTLEEFGSPGWEAAYARRVGDLMQEAGGAGAHVLWVGMPIMGSPKFSEDMQLLNGIYQAQANLHPGTTYFSSWRLFSSPSGQYTATTTSATGQELPLRGADGVHIAIGSGAGSDILGGSVVAEMRALYGLP